MHEASDVATDPGSTVVSRDGGRVVLTGTRDGVAIRVVVDYNRNDIITAYPTNVPRNP
jgi:septal ring factor EnvC (AmiA/AmiB activator)